MSVAELNSIQTNCEVEKTQLLTIIAMSVKNQQLAGFLLNQNYSNFFYVEGSTVWFYDSPHHLSSLSIAEQCHDKSLLVILTLSCILTLSHAKSLNTLIKHHVKTTHKVFLFLTLTPINIMF